MISSKTSFIALIGNPVSHSLSPIMQNAALQYLGLDLIYIAIPCKDEDLELVLNSLKISIILNMIFECIIHNMKRDI